MKSSSHRFLKILFISVISFLILLTIAAKIISAHLEKVISEKLTAVNCQVDSLDLSLFTRTLSGKNIRWISPPDSAHRAPHKVHFARISVKGIGVLPYLLHHELHISRVEGEGGDITYDRALKTKKKAGEKKSNFTTIEIDQVAFSTMNVRITSDTIQEYSANLSFTLNKILAKNLNPGEDIHYDVATMEALVEQVVMQGKTSLYNTTIHRAYLNSKEGIIEIDSIRMNPLKGKFEFANSLGRQKTRVILHIPAIRMTGFDYDVLRDSIFSVSNTEIHDASLSVFRDKRLPFKNPLIPLPMQMLKDEIPFGMKLDTIRIINSIVIHEEMAAGGNETGKINMTDLNATISNFNNRLYDDRPPFSVIRASGKFMKTGLIEASFFMPIKKGVNYEAIGKISHLDLQEINTITEAVGFLRIESGLMNRLNFNFQYNEYKSTGVLDINYENLKMISLNKNKKKEINQFKTFILNALVKKNKDKNTPKEQRTGKIDIERDRRRFVVNVWVMSLFDGLKSAVLPDTQEENPKPKK